MSFDRRHAREILLVVDRSKPETLAHQLEEQLRSAIRAGTLRVGSPLPSSRVLAEELGVSRGVVSRVYSQLAFEGYLILRHKSVPVVCATKGCRAVTAHRKRSRVRYDLRAHLPDVTAFPRKLWLRSVYESLERAPDSDLSYGDSAGLWELRVEVADYLGRARGVVVTPDNVVVTSGSTHSLSLVARVLARGDAKQMAFENPSRALLRRAAHAAGQETLAVAVDDMGIVVSELGHATAAVVSPAHQFPTGVTYSPSRRRDLAAWASRTGAFIIEDDYDAEFRYDGASVPALQSVSPDRVVYFGSTGKTVVPALRLGWAVLPDDLRDDTTQELCSTVLHVSGIDQLALADFLHRGEFDRHLHKMRGVYRGRRETLIDALRRRLPDIQIGGASAGLHVVVEMASHEAAESVRVNALLRGVVFETIAQHTTARYLGPAGLILGFGGLPEPSLEVAASIITHIIEEEDATGEPEETAMHKASAV